VVRACGNREVMKRALINACFGSALAAAFALGAAAQTKSTHTVVRHPARIEQPAAAPEAQIAPTTMPLGGTSIEIGSDRWNARGYSLKMLISQIYDIEAKRIDVADEFDENARYDVSLSLPRDVDDTAMQQILADALQKKFNIRITPETRAMEVYVMSAPSGPGSELHRHGDASNDAGQITYSGKDCPGVSSHAIEASATTISDFGRALEQDLDSVLVDETRLPGSYDFKLGNYSSTNQLLTMLHDQLGLVVRPLERKVTVLKVRPQGEFASL
jgi:uncharacterized protein (TIGR03435 family)